MWLRLVAEVKKRLLDLGNKVLLLLANLKKVNLLSRKQDVLVSKLGTPKILRKVKCPQLTGQTKLNGKNKIIMYGKKESPAKMSYGKSPVKKKGSFVSKHCTPASPLQKKSCKKKY
jgi:hypothetical protein